VDSGSRRARVAEKIGAGLLGLGTLISIDALQPHPEVGFIGGGAVFLLAYNGLRSMRQRRAEST
jgi:hypothetical protein